MVRAKAKGRMPKPLSRLLLRSPGAVEVEVASFVDYVRALPEETDERPSKRARLLSGSLPVKIFRHEFSSVTKSAKTLGAPVHICRKDVGQHLRVGHYRKGVHITMRGNPSKTTSFELLLPTDLSNMPEPVITALDVSWSQGCDPSTEGCIWAVVDLDLRQVGAQVDVKLTVQVYWSESHNVYERSQLRNKQLALRERVIMQYLPSVEYFPRGSAHPPSSISLPDFYDAVCVPERDTRGLDLASTEIPQLAARLYPFQRMSVQWLLNREGVQWSRKTDSPEVVLDPYEPRSPGLPISFVSAKDAEGEEFAISSLFGMVSREPSPFAQLQDIKGGILAEEMGLGKTLEVISLILLHRRPDISDQVYDPYLGKQLRPTKGTLIVAPSSLVNQWQSELGRHAPHLKVMRYTGFRDMAKGIRNEDDVLEELRQHDVVLTTYDVLRKEVHMALEPPHRSMRREKRAYERPRCPLVQLSWWRVCIDEAQMVENWRSDTNLMARLIPRVNAWAITGTPVKDSIEEDLRGLMIFLRFEPYASDAEIWKAFSRRYKGVFRQIFNMICLRHNKSQVRNEIELPPQKRYVITMPFSAVEEQHYQSLFKDLALSCGLDPSGNPLRDNWNPQSQAENMRVALDRLRQTALHPEVGQHNRRALGHRDGPLRTVAEVLDAMMEQSESMVRTLQRTWLSSKLIRGQVLAMQHDTRRAAALWQEVFETSGAIVRDSREQLRQEIELARKSGSENASNGEAPTEPEEGDENMSPRVAEARRRLRSALEIKHRAIFFLANAYYSIKSDKDMTDPDSEEFKRLETLETESYEYAKKIRTEILQEAQGKAKKLMNRLAASASKQDFAVIPGLDSMDQKGIESRKIVEAFEYLCSVLNEQAETLDDWREHVIQLLLKTLLDEETDEITGEEYEQSTKLSEEILVYVQALKTALADRYHVLSGQENFLIEHEYRTAVRQAKEGEGPFPDKLLHLFEIRNKLKPEFDDEDEFTSFRAVIAALRNLSTKLRQGAGSGNQRSAAELAIVTNQLQSVQRQLTEQNKAITLMEQEAELFTGTMNARIEFYRQLQAVSDMVADYEGDETEAGLEAVLRQEENAQQALTTAEAKHRYLVHLKEADSSSGEQRLCVICQSTFTIGVLTICGHQFCKECITLWFKAHRNCPVCKRHLDPRNLHDITLKPQELKVHSEDATTGSKYLHNTPSKKSQIYSEFNPEKLAEIKNINLNGPSFTTKVDTLIRHLLWLRESDPGAKSIVFSQYKDFLDVLGSAFRRYRIGYTSFDKAHGISNFKDDPSMEVFLLHARAHSSGLNLVNASHVFLCEPLLNTALELQAIARVDRIGQEHETTVWLYIVEGTVEESIHNLSVQRRMEHMGQNLKGKSKESTPELLDAKLEAANSMELQQASLSRLMGKGSISGEVVDQNDLWTCLFGHIDSRAAAQLDDDERLRSNPAIRGYLAAEAATARMNGEAGPAV